MQVFDELLNGDISRSPSYFTNCTGSVDYYNFLRTKVNIGAVSVLLFKQILKNCLLQSSVTSDFSENDYYMHRYRFSAFKINLISHYFF